MEIFKFLPTYTPPIDVESKYKDLDLLTLHLTIQDMDQEEQELILNCLSMIVVKSLLGYLGKEKRQLVLDRMEGERQLFLKYSRKEAPFNFEPTDCIFTTNQQARQKELRKDKPPRTYIKLSKYNPYLPGSVFPNPELTDSGIEMSYYAHGVDSNLTDLSMYMKPLKVDEFFLIPNDSLLVDSIFGILPIGGFGRYIFTEEYLQFTYHGHNFDTKEAKLTLNKLNQEKYINKLSTRIVQPFCHMVSTLAQLRWVLHCKFNFNYDSIRPEVNFYNFFNLNFLENIPIFIEFENYFEVIIDLKDIENHKFITIQDLMDYLDLIRGKKPRKNLYSESI